MRCVKATQKVPEPVLATSSFVLDEGHESIDVMTWIDISEQGLTLDEVREHYGEPPEDLIPLFEENSYQ